MMNWKRVRHCRPSGWRDNAEYSVVRHFTEYYRRSGHRNYPGAVDGDSGHRRAGILDLGAQLPSPEWGHVGDALELIYVAPWTVMLPGAAITLSVLLVNLLGDGIRRAIIAGWNNAVTGYPQSHH